MAQRLLYRLRILQQLVSDPPASPPAGSVIEMFWNDSSNEIEVEINGTPSGTPDEIGQKDLHWSVMSGVSSQSGGELVSSYSFCSGTTLNWFGLHVSYPQFPYARKRTTTNSPVCGAPSGGGGGQPAVCDIRFEGAPLVTHATNLTQNNGSIKVTASSSNGDVKFALHDFDYASEGQSTELFPGTFEWTFSGVGPGPHTIWAKDQNRCEAKVQVTVLYKPAETERLRFTWRNLFESRTARVRIFDREYVGDLNEVEAAGPSPFRWLKPKPDGGDLDDKFAPIHGSSIEISFVNTSDFQFLPLSTHDSKRFRCVYEINEGAGFVPMLSGFINPKVNTESFTPTPYTSEMEATDNLNALKEIPFTDDDGNLLRGELKLIKVISFVLQKTGLDLDIQSGINIFETTHAQTASDDPLDQTYVDVECYRSEDGQTMNCYDVLSHILKPFGARVFQSGNRWVIEEIARATEEYSYRLFSYLGEYQSNSTFNPVIDIKNHKESSRAVWADRNQTMEIVPAYGKISVTSRFNYVGCITHGGFEKTDLLPGGTEEDFLGWSLRMPSGVTGVNFRRTEVAVAEGGTAIQSSLSGLPTGFILKRINRSAGEFFFEPGAWSGNLRNAYIESDLKSLQYGPGDKIRFFFDYLSSFTDNYEFLVIRFAVKIGNNWLQRDFTWGASEAIVRLYPSPSSEFQKFDKEFLLPAVSDITDTTVQVRIYFYAHEFFDAGLPGGSDASDDLRALFNPTADVQDDLRVDWLYGILSHRFRVFSELFFKTGLSNDSPNIVLPDDYGTSGFYWSKIKILRDHEGVDVDPNKGFHSFFVDNVFMDFFPRGQAPPETETISNEITKQIAETLEVELFNFDSPANIRNAKNMYNNHFRLASGAPTTKWTRSGTSELIPLQRILLSVLTANHQAPTFRITGSVIGDQFRIRPDNSVRITKKGSSMAITNPDFAANLNGWSQTGSGIAFSWTADNDGSAQVDLAGATDSQKIYQDIVHSGGHIEVSVNVQLVDTQGVREDNLVLLFWKDGKIVHTERMTILQNSGGGREFKYVAHAPKGIDRIGFYFQHVNGVGDCKYNVGKFHPVGVEVKEIYQISDYSFDERHDRYGLELTQISQSYISLLGIDTGGNNQSGAGVGGAYSDAYSDAYA